MKSVLLSFFVVTVVSHSADVHKLPIDAATVQSAAVWELNVGANADKDRCRSLVSSGGTTCPRAGRRYELFGVPRSRALELVNAPSSSSGRACAPTHALEFQTTKGRRVVDVSFACHTLNGRAMARTTEAELATFLRGFGLVVGLPSAQGGR